MKAIIKLKPIEILWMLAFLTFPLLGIRYLRINLGLLHVPIFVMILFAIVIIYFAEICISGEISRFKLNNIQKLYILGFYLFLVLHVFNTFRSLAVNTSVSVLVKLTIALGSFIVISIFFPKDPNFLKKVLSITIFSSTILLLIYIHHYLFVLRAPFLGIDWEWSRSGKNQMGLYLTVMLPIVLWKNVLGKFFSIWLIPTIVHSFAVVYSMSRGTWSSLGLSLTIFLMILMFKKTKYKSRIVLSTFIGISVFAMMFIVFSSSRIFTSIDKTDFQHRVQTLKTMQDYGSESSITTRKDFIRKSLDFFYENPVLGIGTSNFYAISKHVSHNDYMQILGEHGLLGIIIFLLMLMPIIKEIFTRGNNLPEAIGLKQASLAIIIYLNFINAYDILMVHIIFALLFITTYREMKLDSKVGRLSKLKHHILIPEKN